MKTAVKSRKSVASKPVVPPADVTERAQVADSALRQIKKRSKATRASDDAAGCSSAPVTRKKMK